MQNQLTASWQGVDGIVVRQLHHGIASALDAEHLNDTLDQISRHIRELVGAHQSAVSYIPMGDFSRAVHGMSLSDKYAKYRTYDVMPNGKGIWMVVFETKRPMRLTEKELHVHPAFRNFSDIKDVRGLEHPPLPGWLAVPILTPTGQPMGLLQLSDRYEGDFTEQDEAMLQSAAKLIAPTLEGVFLYEQVAAQAQQLQTLNAELQVQRQTALTLAQEAETARQQAESARGETERAACLLARSNADLEQFAFAASHDLQEPLRAISGYCQLLQRQYTGKLDPKADEYIKHAIEGVDRMYSLINDLLEFARVTRQGEPFQTTDCNGVVSEAMARLKVAIEESGAKVQYAELPTLRVDKGQMIRLFQNLISNAIKYRAADRPCEATITVQEKADEVQFAVHDNGIGMEAKHFEKIFVIFQRLHTRTEYPGTGIGLAVCKRIIERHGGRIWVESEVGKGSIFHFTISRHRGEPT